VGAYIGVFALGLAKAVGPSGAVLALEPQPDVFRELVMATAGSRVRALNVAASDHKGVGVLGVSLDACFDPHARQGASLSGSGDGKSWQVQLERLDDLVDASRPVSVMKIDVEGHEREVLAGAEGILTEHHPALVVEIEQRHLSTTSTVAEVVEDLLARGYDCHCIGRRNQVFPWGDFDLEKDQLQWLGADGKSLAVVDFEDYTNNFLFV
jgi:FkbM family methyltransferase